ncbi:hypothetical protein P3T76_011954 [Phytophthora citrophthora]|uniref:Integrase zinc-binding domain-containing protein n=1 Tax=Phytophthora citrophthora TaxID=4793 RepID=A0AAD9LET5_9STRA|nr:hypothetical protein P3T76_011954 [Phytophthora citrophthora]
MATTTYPKLNIVIVRTITQEQHRDTNLEVSDKREIDGAGEPVIKKVLVSTCLGLRLVKSYHDLTLHLGTTTMVNTILQMFYWKCMEANVRALVDACAVCLTTKHPTTKYGKAPPQSMKLPRLDRTLPQKEIQSVDYHRHLDQTNRAIKSFICWIDTDLLALITLHLRRRDIEHVPTTTRNPQANSVIESKRVHRVVGEKTRTKEISTQEEWTEILNNTMFSLPASDHSILKASPAQLTLIHVGGHCSSDGPDD